MKNDQITEIAMELFDSCVNPLANMMCNLLAFQVHKGMISKDEAKYIIASSIDVLNLADVHDDVRDIGIGMLQRMIQAIEKIPQKGV